MIVIVVICSPIMIIINPVKYLSWVDAVNFELKNELESLRKYVEDK